MIEFCGTLLFQFKRIKSILFPYVEEEQGKKGIGARAEARWLYLWLLCEWSASPSDLACSSRCTCMRRDRCCCRPDAAPECRSQTLPDVGWSVIFDHLREESAPRFILWLLPKKSRKKTCQICSNRRKQRNHIQGKLM